MFNEFPHCFVQKFAGSRSLVFNTPLLISRISFVVRDSAFTIIRAFNCSFVWGTFLSYFTTISRFWPSTILFPMRAAMGDVLNLRISFSRQNTLSLLPLPRYSIKKLLPVYFLLSAVIGFARHSLRIK